jgi:hypothetical protein
MLKRMGLILACGVLGSLFAFSVQALPVSSTPAQMAAPAATLVRDFCGLGFHRGPYGYCVRNGVPYYGYVPPPPAVVVGVPRACPWGFYMGPYGRCYQH